MLLFLILLSIPATFGQDDIGCYVPGQCLRSLILNKSIVDSPEECLANCKQWEGGIECKYFTFYTDSQVQYIYGFIFKTKNICLFAVTRSVTIMPTVNTSQLRIAKIVTQVK